MRHAGNTPPHVFATTRHESDTSLHHQRVFDVSQKTNARQIAELDYEMTSTQGFGRIQFLTFFREVQVARKGIAQLEEENDKLWQENSRLWEKNERLVGMVEKYQAAGEDPDDDDSDESDDDEIEES